MATTAHAQNQPIPSPFTFHHAIHIGRKRDTCDRVVMLSTKLGHGETRRYEKRKNNAETNVLTLIYNVSTDQSLREAFFKKIGLHQDEWRTEAP